jgi:hypothetical protein
VLRSSILLWQSIDGALRSAAMSEPANRPGPGRSTADDAFSDIKKQIAERNSKAHKAARERHSAHEQILAAKRRRANP